MGRPVVVVQLVASTPSGAVPAGQVSLDARTAEVAAGALEAWDRRGLGSDPGLVELVSVLRSAVRAAAGFTTHGDTPRQAAPQSAESVADGGGPADGGDVARPLATVDHVAARFGLSPRTVLRRVADGQLRAIRVGRAFRFDPVDVAEFERRHETKQGA